MTIVGSVTGDREAVIRVPVHGLGGRVHELDAIIDTGFNGYLTLPDSLVDALKLPLHSLTIVTLGDGSNRALRQYEAVVGWGQQEVDVLVLAAEGGPLVGMSLLYGYKVFLHVVDGGRVTIEAAST